VAILVDRGLVRYDDLVTRHWPEFGKDNGKENITIADVMRHEGGVPFLVDPKSPDGNSTIVITPEDVASIDGLEDKICSAPVNSGRMYHAITRGWLINGIVRRVDPARRTLGVFMKEEICDRFGLTYFCGIPAEEQAKSTDIEQ
jgi:CubicO group peptidase (beta-lactamase class C family)